ncbi:MAG: FecR domain-containing protein [Hyphomonadaceae bacterium]|nr:FecR domain-containing protein [Hyphomonadaceae bacterium]
MGRSRQPTAAEAAASRWLARLASPDITADERRQFESWLSEAPEHRAAIEAMSSTWDRLGDLPRTPLPARRGASRPARFSGYAVAAAAALAFIVLCATVWTVGRFDERVLVAQARAPVVEHFPDGSTVELNAKSVVRYRFRAQERLVTVDEGEAFFDVAPDPKRPFLVRTPLGTLRVVGTSFSVRVGADAVHTTVVTGTVEALPTAQTSGEPDHRVDRQRTALLGRPNEEIELTERGATVSSVGAAAVQRRLAWRQGMLELDGETLGYAASEIERHTGVHFEFEDPAIEALRVGGYIKANDIDAFDALLQSNFGLYLQRIDDNRVRVVRRSPQPYSQTVE